MESRRKCRIQGYRNQIGSMAGLLGGLLVVCLAAPSPAVGRPYACEDDLIEVMFIQDSRVRLRGGVPVDLATTKGLDGVPEVLGVLEWFKWQRISDVPEARLDEMQASGSARSGQDLYNLNNIYRLRIPKGHDVWAIGEQLEALPGIILAKPVPKPMPPPTPPDYISSQGYLRPASATPTGIDADYAWTQAGGDGTGVTVCDLEYSWNYNHADVTKAVGSQINSNVSDPFSDNNHGTAVIGVLVSDDNGWGTTGICHGANLLTCGTYYGTPSPSWNVPGALILAINTLSAGDVILLEQQWDYTGSGDYIPIEWWLNSYPSTQTNNAVYCAITQAVSHGIHVVEAGGNGAVDTDALRWYGDCSASVAGAGGAYAGGTYPEGDLQRLSFSSYGWRYQLQGWGENVVTTAYGDLYSAEGPNYYYTDCFSGTSSSAAIVAGAVACCLGYWEASISPTPPPPRDIRDDLCLTGSLQIYPPDGAIGQRPDLQAMFAYITPTCSCPFQSDFDEDSFITALDLASEIDALFSGGPDPTDPACPTSRGDFDCDSFNTALDLAGLIDHLFSGGAGPCDPCGPLGTLIGSAGCKTFSKVAALEDVPSDQDCIEYDYDGRSVLRFRHVNAGFNCCPDSFSADFTIGGGSIVVDEVEWLSNPCWCLCLFDLDCEIVGLPPGEYTIRINEPYIQEGDEILEFTVDLVSSPSGIYCVRRDEYPWGGN